MSLDFLFPSLGQLWILFGFLSGALGPLWSAWVAMGIALDCLGACIRFLMKWNVKFQANGIQVRCLCTKSSLPALSPGSRQSRQSARSATWPAARNPPSSARGARMKRDQNKLPQIITYICIYIYIYFLYILLC